VPCDLAEDDYLLFEGMGAYGSVTATQFNGFGALRTAIVSSLKPKMN
jgi:ornithine decarboxylase